MENKGYLSGIFIALGIIVFGYMLSSTIIKVKNMDRVVSVKGLAKREVKADIAIYPIQFEVADNNPLNLYKKIKTKKDIVIDFLKKQGFEDNEISIASPQIVDNFAKDYNSNARFRYTGSVVITLYTKKVQKAVNLGKELFKLSELGVMASNLKYQTSYLYTKLNKIKPIMIEEAIKNAQKAAEKFARDSNSQLNGIKSAKQGYFSIVDRDINTPYIKRVRVVTNVVYYLQ
jgi:hypothetical protein